MPGQLKNVENLLIITLLLTFAANFFAPVEMKYLEQFVIPFVGLNIGSHDYHFEIDEQFFGNFELSEIERGKVSVKVNLLKEERMLTFLFDIEGYVELTCDRCLNTYKQPVKGNEHLFVKFGDEPREESDDVIIISSNDYQVNISQFIYEFIVLLLPIKHVHDDSASENSSCNSSIIDKLNELNSKRSDNSQWDALKEIKDKFED